MNTKYAIISAILAFVPNGSAYSNNDVPMSQISAIVVDGPYEITNEKGVIGYVIAREEKLVMFAPCDGRSFKLDPQKLTKTDRDCRSSPSPKEIPLIVDCSSTNYIHSALLAKFNATGYPIGTLISIDEKQHSIHARENKTEEATIKIATVHKISTCGTSLAGFNARGQPVIQFIKAYMPFTDLEK